MTEQDNLDRKAKIVVQTILGDELYEIFEREGSDVVESKDVLYSIATQFGMYTTKDLKISLLVSKTDDIPEQHLDELGQGLDAHREYVKRVIPHIRKMETMKLTGLELLRDLVVQSAISLFVIVQVKIQLLLKHEMTTSEDVKPLIIGIYQTASELLKVSPLSESNASSLKSVTTNYKKHYGDILQDLPEPKKGCFIATAVYGSYDHPAVIEFRRFRDHFLMNSVPGRSFVRIYYRYGPVWAEKIGRNKTMIKTVRFLLDGFYRLLKN